MTKEIKEKQHVLTGRLQILEYEIKNLAAGLEKFYVLLEKIHSLELINKGNTISFDSINKINENHEERIDACEKNINKLQTSLKVYEKFPKIAGGILAFISSLWILWYSIDQYNNNKEPYNIKSNKNNQHYESK